MVSIHSPISTSFEQAILQWRLTTEIFSGPLAFHSLFQEAADMLHIPLSTRFQLSPSAVITGKMFGNGVYFANASTKSAGYIGTNKDNIGFMFLCEIALGTPKKETQSVSHSGTPVGYDSVHGVGQWQPDQESHIIKQDGLIIPVGKLQNFGGSGLLYDEFIVYDTAQIKMKYLLELEIGNAK